MAGKIKELVPAGQGKETPPARREEEYPLFLPPEGRQPALRGFLPGL